MSLPNKTGETIPVKGELNAPHPADSDRRSKVPINGPQCTTEEEVNVYQLDYILQEPQESEGHMYLAEIPALQGAMAWGEAPEKTIHGLLAITQTIIQLSKEEGERLPLPPGLTPIRDSKGTLTIAA